jgi:hypothetical protein
MGEWVGVGAGSPGAGTGRFSFQPALDGKILVRKSRTEYPAKPGEKSGSVHEDLMIVYRLPDEKNCRAIYFDNEGHVIRYGIVFGAETASVAFESEGSSQETRFRLTYRLRGANDLETVFAIAPPGQEYKTYLQGFARHRP